MNDNQAGILIWSLLGIVNFFCFLTVYGQQSYYLCAFSALLMIISFGMVSLNIYQLRFYPEDKPIEPAYKETIHFEADHTKGA